VHLTSKNIVYELIAMMSSNLYRNDEIMLKLKRVPDKIRLVFEPLCKEIIRLRETRKQAVNSIASCRMKSKLMDYLQNPDLKKAQEASIDQLVKDFSYSQQKN